MHVYSISQIYLFINPQIMSILQVTLCVWGLPSSVLPGSYWEVGPNVYHDFTYNVHVVIL